MIKSFRHKGLQRFYLTGSTASIQPVHARRLRMLLAALDTAQTIDDMDVPGFRLHRLHGRAGHRWSVRVNGKRLLAGLRGLSLMAMHNPPHPGEFIREVYLEPFGLSARQLAQRLGISASTLTRVLKGSSGISPEMALRLSRALGRSPESWLEMQDRYDLWIARQHVRLDDIEPIKFDAA